MTFDTLASIHLDAGNLDRALAEIRRGLEFEPYIVELRTTLGRIHLARGENDAAATELRMAVELDAKSWLTHYNLGLALGEMGRHDAALEALEKARALNQRGPRVARALGEAYFRSAAAALKRRPPDPAEARENAARARELGFEVPEDFWRSLEASGGR
jgi:tetratricopeptide (TPR) repeat protein